MVFDRDYFGRLSLSNLAGFLVGGNVGEAMEAEAPACEQYEALERREQELLRQFKEKILAYDWAAATGKQAELTLPELYNDLYALNADRQLLYFKVGFASGLRLAGQLGNLCGDSGQRNG